MNQTELQRLIKIEQESYKIIKEEFKLQLVDIEFDVVPEQKMFEIMAYHMPGQIPNWKFGRDFEKIRTIFTKTGGNLPLEVVVPTNPARAYLMKDNSFAVQVLVMTHVLGHVCFSTMNKYHHLIDNDLVSKLNSACQRITDYERKFGMDNVEKIIDAGHSIQFHSTPLESEETEDEKRNRIFEQRKKSHHDKKETEFYDMIDDKEDPVAFNVDFYPSGGNSGRGKYIERELFNNQLWNTLKLKTPIEPTEDLLRYVIDNSRILSSWEKDILEIIRIQGRQYYWSLIKTKYINEGFACFIHEKIMRRLFNMSLLTSEEHAEYNYCNSLVKARNPYSMNPYLIGSAIWEDIEDRWNKGKHGEEWENIDNLVRKKEWDTKEMKGWEKVNQVLRTNHDWFFMNEFLTNDLTRELELYIYIQGINFMENKLIVTDHSIDQVRQLIVMSFSHSGVPKIRVIDGNSTKNSLLLEHEHIGIDLDETYCNKTLEHIKNIWGYSVYLKTIKDKVPYMYSSDNSDLNIKHKK